MIYTFKENDPLAFKNSSQANPQIIGTAVAKIAEDNKGLISPVHVWKAAQNPEHPLHKHYEWDIKKAAEIHWKDTSRRILRVIRVSSDEEPKATRAFISISTKKGTAYRTVQDVRTNIDLQAAALNAAHRDLEAFEARYREFGEICSIVRMARKAISTKRVQQEEMRADH
jgi:hypothetical protein